MLYFIRNSHLNISLCHHCDENRRKISLQCEEQAGQTVVISDETPVMICDGQRCF